MQWRSPQLVGLINSVVSGYVLLHLRSISDFTVKDVVEWSILNLQVVPQTQELQFTYIPGGSEIISIDAYNRSTTANDFVIGITIIKVN